MPDVGTKSYPGRPRRDPTEVADEPSPEDPLDRHRRRGRPCSCWLAAAASAAVGAGHRGRRTRIAVGATWRCTGSRTTSRGRIDVPKLRLQPTAVRDRPTAQHEDGRERRAVPHATVRRATSTASTGALGRERGGHRRHVGRLQQAFMATPPHRSNILNGAFRHVAVGVVRVDGHALGDGLLLRLAAPSSRAPLRYREVLRRHLVQELAELLDLVVLVVGDQDRGLVEHLLAARRSAPTSAPRARSRRRDATRSRTCRRCAAGRSWRRRWTRAGRSRRSAPPATASSSRIVFIRSWVIGRGVTHPWSDSAIAAASAAPIQIGR